MNAARSTLPSTRITAIDTLRGFAILGVLPVNIQGFAMISATFTNPAAYGDLTGWNFWIWFFTYSLGDSKLLALFSLLFGASLLFIQQREEAGQAQRTTLHQLRRLGILFVFGMVHAYLIWPGDVLVCYALCGTLLLPALKLPPRHLVLAGLFIFAVPTIGAINLSRDMDQWDMSDWQQAQQNWMPPTEQYQNELDAYRGNWLQQQSQRVPEAFNAQTQSLPEWVLWRAAGLMLFGMALFKLGVLTGKRPVQFYRYMTLFGLGLGAPIMFLNSWLWASEQWSMEYFVRVSYLANYWLSLLIVSGYIGLTMWICQSGRFQRLTEALANVGRMALSNYLLQSIICTLIFYGHGFGLFGKVNRTGQFIVVIAVWVLLVLLSNIWLKHFRYGPLEWLWRRGSSRNIVTNHPTTVS